MSGSDLNQQEARWVVRSFHNAKLGAFFPVDLAHWSDFELLPA
jgi:hypothetical protein